MAVPRHASMHRPTLCLHSLPHIGQTTHSDTLALHIQKDWCSTGQFYFRIKLEFGLKLYVKELLHKSGYTDTDICLTFAIFYTIAVLVAVGVASTSAFLHGNAVCQKLLYIKLACCC